MCNIAYMFPAFHSETEEALNPDANGWALTEATGAVLIRASESVCYTENEHF